VVLAVLQNYAGLTIDRLFNMLKNSGKFSGSQSAVSSILNSLVSQGKVQNDNGTYRFVSGGRASTPAAARTSSPVRSSSPASYSAPAARAPTPSAGAGAGAQSKDDAVVLAVLQNYAGLTIDRLFNMLKNSGKFSGSQSAVSSILNSLVSQGKVQNDNGTYRFVSGGRASTPAAARTSSPVRSSSPASYSSSSFSASSIPRPTSRPGSVRPASVRPATPSAGGGASSTDDAVVLSLLQNYAGLAEDRLFNMLKNSGKFSGSQSSLSNILRGLVSRGKVQNDRGTYRFISK